MANECHQVGLPLSSSADLCRLRTQVREAWWSLAMFETFRSAGQMQSKSKRADAVLRIRALVESAQRAEEQMLPVLKEQEDLNPPSEAKAMMLRFLDATGQQTNKTPPLFEQARLAANDKFKRGLFDEAVSQYTALLDVVTRGEQGAATLTSEHLHVLLSNRSCAHAKLQQFSAAEQHARAAIAARPAWLKGHVRLARALLGREEPARVLEALSQARAQLSQADQALLQALGFDAEAQALLADAAGASPAKRKLSGLACWANVLFKQAAVVVDCKGSGDFTSLREALTATQPSQCSVIMLPGSYRVHWPRLAGGRIVQILGEGQVKLTREGGAMFVLRSDKGCKLFLENLHIDAVPRAGKPRARSRSTASLL